jgi:hypothetical protein
MNASRRSRRLAEQHRRPVDDQLWVLPPREGQRRRTRRSALPVYPYLALHWKPYADTQQEFPVASRSTSVRFSAVTGARPPRGLG